MQTMGEQENLQQPKQRQPNETQQPLSNCFFLKIIPPLYSVVAKELLTDV